jgi:hypothetical protein
MSTLPFGIIVPGMPAIVSFNETAGIFHVDLENPQNIANITFFLTT